MRKYIRHALRIRAEREGVKPSKYVAAAWDRLSVKKYGAKRRRIHQATGTHKRATWGSRISFVA